MLKLHTRDAEQKEKPAEISQADRPREPRHTERQEAPEKALPERTAAAAVVQKEDSGEAGEATRPETRGESLLKKFIPGSGSDREK
jgi:hypothetical protein